MALRSLNLAGRAAPLKGVLADCQPWELQRTAPSVAVATRTFAGHGFRRICPEGPTKTAQWPSPLLLSHPAWPQLLSGSSPAGAFKRMGRKHLRLLSVCNAVPGTPPEEVEPEQPTASTSGSNKPETNSTQSSWISTADTNQLDGTTGRADATISGTDPVQDYGFLGELPAAFTVLLRMGLVNGLALVLLQAFLWFLQEMLQVATVKMIRAFDPLALVVVNKPSVYTALTFFVVNVTYLTLAMGFSITAVTRTVAATLSNRPLHILDTLQEWWKNARVLAVAQLKVYWPLLLVIIYAGLEGDRFLDDTRTQQLELIQEMKILNRINPLTLIALYPGLRLLRIASWFSFFFYTLTVIPMMGVAGPAILLEGVTSKQAVQQRRFVHPDQFPRTRLLPLLAPIAIMLYFTFFTKAPLPINVLTIVEWSHQVRARLGKAACLLLANLIQVLLYVSYRKAKDGDAFGSEQLGEYVDRSDRGGGKVGVSGEDGEAAGVDLRTVTGLDGEGPSESTQYKSTGADDVKMGGSVNVDSEKR